MNGVSCWRIAMDQRSVGHDAIHSDECETQELMR